MVGFIKKISPIKQFNSIFASHFSFAQVGEDRIVLYFFKSMLERKSITYMDIGANDPVKFNNTYLLYRFYEQKKGVLVDADPDCVERLKRKRKKDICLNYGLDAEVTTETMYFYRFFSNTLNTFSKEEADRFQEKGYKIRDTISVPIITINELHDRYFSSDQDVDFLSIDIEGLDSEVLHSIEYDRWKPLVICMESAEFCGGKRSDLQELREFLKDKGYEILGETWINTIFVQKDLMTEYLKK